MHSDCSTPAVFALIDSPIWLYALGLCALLGAALWIVAHRFRQLAAEKAQLVQQTSAYIADLQKKLQHLQEKNRTLHAFFEVGQRLKGSLQFERCVSLLYAELNKLMDADAFGIGIYHPERQELTYRAFVDMGVRLPDLTVSMTDTDRPAIWCIQHQQDILINDFEKEYSAYIERLPIPRAAGQPKSLLFSPLFIDERLVGVITVQSYKANAYTLHHLEQLKTLSLYAAFAIDRLTASAELSPQFESSNLSKPAS